LEGGDRIPFQIIILVFTWRNLGNSRRFNQYGRKSDGDSNRIYSEWNEVEPSAISVLYHSGLDCTSEMVKLPHVGNLHTVLKPLHKEDLPTEINCTKSKQGCTGQ